MFFFLFDPINVSLLVAALLSTFLGILIIIGGKNRRVSIIYGLNIMAIIGWIMAMFFYRSAPPTHDMLWCTVLYLMPTLIASSFLYFTYIFPSRKEKSLWWRIILIFVAYSLIAIMTAWPGLIIKEVNVRPGQEKEIIFTAYYWFYFLYTLFFFSLGFLRLFIKYFRGKGTERLQIIYLAFGYALAANLAFVTNLIMPWMGLFFLNWLGQMFSCIMVGFTTYAIMRYRLMDIRVIFRRAIIYFIMSVFVYCTFYVVTWFYNAVFGGPHGRAAYIVGIVVAPVFVLLFSFVESGMRRVANKYLFLGLRTSQEMMARLINELNSSIDLSKIIDLIVNSIKDALRLERVGILLFDRDNNTNRYNIAKAVGFKVEEGVDLVKDGLLILYLEKTQKPVVVDELAMVSARSVDAGERKRLNKLVEAMNRIEISLCLPMFLSNKLVGMIVLGGKISGDAYTTEDLDLLDTLAKQASIAIDNARLYKQVSDFNKTLEKKVAEQTKDLKKAYETEKQAKEGLEMLDEEKNQFLLTVQHHLRTPLTSMVNYADLLLAENFGKLPKKARPVIERFEGSTSGLIKMVNDFLDVTQFHMDKGPITLKDGVSLHGLIEDIIKDVELEAKNKGIYFKVVDFKANCFLRADETKLKAALTNIFDNAVKYTDKGGVTFSVLQEDNNVHVKVEDTGLGIPKEKLSKIFDVAFVRGENAKKNFSAGRGIGLYLSGKIIKAHNGKVWAESAGEGKGSVFHIILPLSSQPSAPQQTKP